MARYIQRCLIVGWVLLASPVAWGLETIAPPPLQIDDLLKPIPPGDEAKMKEATLAIANRALDWSFQPRASIITRNGREIRSYEEMSDAARIERARLEVMKLRPPGNEGVQARNAEYFLDGVNKAVKKNDPDYKREFLDWGPWVAGPYDTAKEATELYNSLVGEKWKLKWMEADSGQPNSSSGGAFWAYFGLVAGWQQPNTTTKGHEGPHGLNFRNMDFPEIRWETGANRLIHYYIIDPVAGSTPQGLPANNSTISGTTAKEDMGVSRRESGVSTAEGYAVPPRGNAQVAGLPPASQPPVNQPPGSAAAPSQRQEPRTIQTPGGGAAAAPAAGTPSQPSGVSQGTGAAAPQSTISTSTPSSASPSASPSAPASGTAGTAQPGATVATPAGTTPAATQATPTGTPPTVNSATPTGTQAGATASAPAATQPATQAGQPSAAPAGTQATGTPAAGTPATGTQAPGTQAPGTQAAGNQAASTQAGSQNAGSQAAGSQAGATGAGATQPGTAGAAGGANGTTQTATQTSTETGTQPAGTQPAGTEPAGTQTANGAQTTSTQTATETQATTGKATETANQTTSPAQEKAAVETSTGTSTATASTQSAATAAATGTSTATTLGGFSDLPERPLDPKLAQTLFEAMSQKAQDDILWSFQPKPLGGDGYSLAPQPFGAAASSVNNTPSALSNALPTPSGTPASSGLVGSGLGSIGSNINVGQALDTAIGVVGAATGVAAAILGAAPSSGLSAPSTSSNNGTLLRGRTNSRTIDQGIQHRDSGVSTSTISGLTR